MVDVEVYCEMCEIEDLRLFKIVMFRTEWSEMSLYCYLCHFDRDAISMNIYLSMDIHIYIYT